MELRQHLKELSEEIQKMLPKDMLLKPGKTSLLDNPSSLRLHQENK